MRGWVCISLVCFWSAGLMPAGDGGGRAGFQGPAVRGQSHGGHFQSRGGFRGGGARIHVGNPTAFGFQRSTSGFQRFPTDVGLPPVGPIPPLGVDSSFFGTRTFDRRFHGAHTGGFFPAVPVIGGVYGYAPPAPPAVIVVQQPAPAQPPVEPKPPEPIRSVIREYELREPEPEPADKETPAFSIVLEDGSVLEAIAAWVENDTLRFVTPEGRYGQAPLAAIDRESTHQQNREKKLNLRLPAPLE